MNYDDDLIRRGEVLELRDAIADSIGARPTSSIHSALCEYANAIAAIAAVQPAPVAADGELDAMIERLGRHSHLSLQSAPNFYDRLITTITVLRAQLTHTKTDRNAWKSDAFALQSQLAHAQAELARLAQLAPDEAAKAEVQHG